MEGYSEDKIEEDGEEEEEEEIKEEEEIRKSYFKTLKCNCL